MIEDYFYCLLSLNTRRLLSRSTMRLLRILLLLSLFPGFILGNLVVQGQDQLPLISNVRFSNNIADRTLIITYDVTDAEASDVEILLRASFDEGLHFLVNTDASTGDVGYPVTTGPDKEIVWFYGDYWDNVDGKTIRLVADDLVELDVEELLEQVDAERMRGMLEYISEPRSFQVNEEHLYDVRDSLIELFGRLDYDVSLQEFQHRARTATNVIGRKPGLGDEATTYIMDAHYDAEKEAPGADDNGSGVVGFLEAMRILSPYQFDKSIEFIGFDQEEEGLLGSITYAWLGGIEPWKTIEGVLNYEMIGYFTERPNTQQVPLGFDLLFEEEYQDLVDNEFRGDFIFITGNEASENVVNAFNAAADTYIEGLKVVSAIVPLNGLIAPDLLRSDHAPFWFKGISAIMITDGSEFRNHNYHTESDVIDSLDMDFMKQVTQAGLAALIDLADYRHAGVATLVVNSVVTGIHNEQVLDCNISMFPVPTHDRLTIQSSDCLKSEEGVQIELRDITGRLVHEGVAYQQPIGIDLSFLECGSYLLDLKTSRGRLSRRVIIQ